MAQGRTLPQAWGRAVPNKVQGPGRRRNVALSLKQASSLQDFSEHLKGGGCPGLWPWYIQGMWLNETGDGGRVQATPPETRGPQQVLRDRPAAWAGPGHGALAASLQPDLLLWHPWWPGL